MTFILRDAALLFINTWFFQIILSLMEIRQTIIKKHPDFVIRKIPIYNLLTNNVLYPFTPLFGGVKGRSREFHLHVAVFFFTHKYSRPGLLCLFGYLLVGGSLTPEA